MESATIIEKITIICYFNMCKVDM